MLIIWFLSFTGVSQQDNLSCDSLNFNLDTTSSLSQRKKIVCENMTIFTCWIKEKIMLTKIINLLGNPKKNSF